MLYPIDNDEVLDDSVQNAAGETAQDIAMRKYENDYGRWRRWSEPRVYRGAAGGRERKKTEKENADFKKNNKDFCDNFIADQKNRKRVMPKRTRRPAGNA